jgi:hypothetical protein
MTQRWVSCVQAGVGKGMGNFAAEQQHVPFGQIMALTITSNGGFIKKPSKLTTNAGAPVVDNQNVMTAGPRGPMLLQDVWFLEKLAHFDREVIPERRMHADGSGAHGTFTQIFVEKKGVNGEDFNKSQIAVS